MDVLRVAELLCVVLASCGESRSWRRDKRKRCLGRSAVCTSAASCFAAGTVRSLHARTLKQTSACITSTTTVDFTTQGLATDPWCLKVGEQSSSSKNCADSLLAIFNLSDQMKPNYQLVPCRRFFCTLSQDSKPAMRLPHTELRQRHFRAQQSARLL